MASGLHEYTVIEAEVYGYDYSEPKTKPALDRVHTECLVKIGNWHPPGCESWFVQDDEFETWVKSYRVLASPPKVD